MDLKGKTLFITGGSRGIGLAIAKRAAADGANIVVAAKPITSLIETKRLMKKGQQGAVLQQMADEGESFRRLLTSPAAKEAFTAFMEKRRPDFSKV